MNIMNKAQCPRCGYDLGGEIASWTDRSPMRGICSECGLGFAWGDIFGDYAEVPRWMVDVRRPGRRLIRFYFDCWRLLIELILPWRLWKRITLFQTSRPWMLIVWLVVLVVPIKLIGDGAIACAEEKYSTIFSTFSGTGNTFSISSCWKIMWTQHLPSPIWTSEYGWWSEGDRWYGDAWNKRASGLLNIGAASGAWIVFVWVMPTSLRRAKVRVSHIARASILSLGWVVLVNLYLSFEHLFDALSRFGLGNFWWRVLPDVTPDRADALTVIGLLWVSAWWFFVFHSYLKLPRAWLTWLVVFILVLVWLHVFNVAADAAGFRDSYRPERILRWN